MVRVIRDDGVEDDVPDEELNQETTTRAGLRRDENLPGVASSGGGDIHAVGTPGGGLSAGGLGGTNAGGGAPTGVDIDESMGAGIHDRAGQEDDEEQAFSGRSGGAVGGTPAGKRVRGGRTHGGLNPGNSTGADNTIGTDPQK